MEDVIGFAEPMNWFCYQNFHGKRQPVAFSERPSKERDLIWHTLREIPEHLRRASIAEIEFWFEYAG